MSVKKRARRSASKATYCPSCQRVFRVSPGDRMCPADGRGLIGIGDPLPTRSIALLPVSFTVSIGIFVSLGIAAF